MTNRLSAPHALRGLFAALILSIPQLQAEPAAVSTSDGVSGTKGKSQQMTSPDQVPQGLAKSDWQSIRAAHEAGRHAFQPVQGKDGHWQAQNPGQQWHTTFDQRGFMTSPLGGGWTWGLELESYGFGEKQTSVSGTPQVKAEGQRLAYQWDATVQEWYVNDQRGLEHGFTLSERPAAGSAPSSPLAPLSFTLSTRGGLKPKVAADSVQFQNASGTTVLNYSGLKVWDADGKKLPARFESSGTHGFRLLVQESTARYPITIDPVAQQAYLKASNTGADDNFGASVAVDGDTAVVGAPQDPNAPADAGMAYVFTRSAGVWSQQAILVASNAGAGDLFGSSVAVDGDTIIVGAFYEDSNARTVNGDGSNNGFADSGAAYVFTRTAGVWTQQAYLKASNADPNDRFGYSVDVSGDTVVVGANAEASNATTVNGNSANTSFLVGAAYVFTRSAGAWTQQAYLKANNSGSQDYYGWAVAVDGDTVVVGAPNEDSNATTVNGNGANNSAESAGAAYVYTRSAGVWTQQAYLKANNSGAADEFGRAVDVSGDTVVIGAFGEDSNATTVNGDGSNNTVFGSGAAYVFTRSAGTWTQQAYLKANNSSGGDGFGRTVAVDGDVVVIGAQSEDGSSTGINGASDDLVSAAGAAYVFVRSSGIWSQQSYLKASQVSPDDFFSRGVAVSGGTVVVGANNEDSSSTGINSTPNEGATNSGAAYIFSGLGPVAPAPTVTNVSPATGSTLGGTVVTITGTDFTDATAVTFGGTNATSFTVNSATQITATTPAGSAGTASVLVTTPGGTNAANTLYTYVIPQTTVTSVTSSSPNGTYIPGNSVSITVAFSENVAVTGTPTLTLETGTTDRTASFDSVSGSELTFVYNVQLGDSATDLDYISNAALSLNSGTILATADGSPANLTLPAPGAPGSLGANKNIVIRTPVPVVSYVESDTGLTSGGASVSIYGGPFFGSTTVTFGGVPATNVSVTGSRIFCTTPAHAFGPVNVEVTTPAGTSEPNTAFTYYNTTLTGGWASNSSGIPVALHNVHFVSASTGWASGASAMIHKSTDGGVTWTSQSSSQTAASYNTLFGLTFADANTGWASSAFGTLIKTTDGGDNWLQQSPSTGQQIWTVFARTPTTAWIAGSAGMIGRTTDGTNWTSSENNPPGNPNTGLNDIQFLDANNGYAIAGGGWSAKTTDGGATWTQMPGALPNGGVNNSYRLAALSFVDVNTGWAVGSQGTIIKTTDAGATWVTQNSGVLTQTLHGVSFVDANKGWAVGDTGIILQTVNGGTTWTVVNSGTGFVFLDVHFIDEATGWVVGDFGRVLRYSAPQVAPVVSLVSPASGSTLGGTVVTITGTNFTNVTAVSFGGTAATSFTVDSATQITATTPAHAAGAVSVLVTTPGGSNAANTLFTYSAASPDIAVSGNGQAIVSADMVPAAADGTDFGSTAVSGGSVIRSFIIANTGPAALNLTSTAPNYVILTGDTAHFSVTTQPATPVAATSGTSTFVITFDPTSTGTKNAVVSIASDDPDESPYTFAITGNGQDPLPIPSALDDVVTAGSAPGADGTSNIGQFGVLRRGGFLAENGFLAFPGFLQGVPATSNSGLWKTGGGNLFLLARTGTTVPDVPSATFATLPEVPWISESGLVSFLASMTVGSGGVTTANDTGLWSEIGGGGLRLLLREDDDVPGRAGVKIGSFASGIYATASTGVNSGHAIVSVTFKGASTKSAVLRAQVSGGTTTISVVAEESTAAPGTAAVYANVSGSYTDPGRMDAQGNFIYSALTTTSSREGIWYQPVGGSVSKVFYAGETAPGTGGATFARLQRPASGNNGVVAFRATLNRDGDNAANMRNDGIWRGTASNPASFACILRRGDGSSVVSNLPVGSLVGNPWGGWLNNNNRGAWRAWLDVNGDGNSAAPTDVNAIFTDLSGAMQLALRVGDAAPGTTGATFSGFDLPIVGGNNQYAVIGNLAGGDAVTANNQGLWRSAPNGGVLSLVFRKGASVVTTEGSKVVTKIDLPGSGQTDRRWEQPVMDSTGRMVVYVTFSDGSTSQVIIP